MTTAVNSLVVARRVLSEEAQALHLLGEGLGDNFMQAVDILAKIPGRVIVSGMGKSGHVACKIAATLASTGTPSFFVHPAEASHGDLGMIDGSDAVIALSNSGETPELNDLIAYTRRFAIPLIAITREANSTLGTAADIPLILPPVAEACSLGLAPTTSTTMMIALGDALAVSLLEHKGFKAEDFQVFHPGGQLGKRLLKVGDIMHEGVSVPLVSAPTPMSDALLVMTAKSFGCVGVTDTEGHLIGIITDGDLRRNLSGNLLQKKADAVMTVRPKTIRPSLLAVEALRIMNTSSITSLFVVDCDKPVGILHLHDCLRAGVA